MDALNSVNGNTIAWMLDQDLGSGLEVRDMFLCDDCRSLVSEEDWNSKKKRCKECAK